MSVISRRHLAAISIVMLTAALSAIAPSAVAAETTTAVTDSYPAVPLQPLYCNTQAEKLAKLQLDVARAQKNLENLARFGAKPGQLEEARLQLNRLGRLLIAAKYDHARCLNRIPDQPAPPNQACIALALDYNQALELLEEQRSLEAYMYERLDIIRKAQRSGGASADDVRAAQILASDVTRTREDAEAVVAAAEARFRDNRDCVNFPLKRPEKKVDAGVGDPGDAVVVGAPADTVAVSDLGL
jgi:hypothetical protein